MMKLFLIFLLLLYSCFAFAQDDGRSSPLQTASPIQTVQPMAFMGPLETTGPVQSIFPIDLNFTPFVETLSFGNYTTLVMELAATKDLEYIDPEIKKLLKNFFPSYSEEDQIQFSQILTNYTFPNNLVQRNSSSSLFPMMKFDSVSPPVIYNPTNVISPN